MTIAMLKEFKRSDQALQNRSYSISKQDQNKRKKNHHICIGLWTGVEDQSDEEEAITWY